MRDTAVILWNLNPRTKKWLTYVCVVQIRSH